MLCKVFIEGNSDRRSQQQALLKAVRAIATAAANSTPSVTGYSTAGTTNDPYEVITVLDNQYAGGWTIDTSQSNLVENGVAATSTGFEAFMLYTTTNKSSEPYAFFAMSEAIGSNNNGTQYAPFIYWGFGDETKRPWGYTSDSNYNFTNVNINHASLNTQRKMFLPIGGSPNRRSHFLSLGYPSQTTSDYIFYVSSSSEHITIASSSSSSEDLPLQTINGGGFFHWGTRTSHTWEDTYSDNPYWVAVWLTSDRSISVPNYCSGYWTMMRHVNIQDQTVSGPFVHYRWTNENNNSSGSGHCPVTSRYGATSYLTITTPANTRSYDLSYFQKMDPISSVNTTAIGTSVPSGLANMATSSGNSITSRQAVVSDYGLQQPLIDYPYRDYVNNTAHWTLYNGVILDSTGNSYLPAATPIYIKAEMGKNFGGYLKHFFKGIDVPNRNVLNDYIQPEGLYEIEGKHYLPISLGHSELGTQNNSPLSTFWVSV